MNTIARLGLTPTRSRVSAPPTTIFISATRHLHTLPRVQFESHIPASRALGVAYAAQIAQEELCVYTDGSAFGGGVGGAARARTPAGTLVMKEHLGPQRQDSQDGHGHIAVEGEILGIILGLGIIKAFPGVQCATVLVDCRQAISELQRGSGQSKYACLTGSTRRRGIWVRD